MFVSKPNDRALFVYNPNSGKRIVEENIDYIESVLKSKFNHVDIIKSKSAEHYKEVIRKGCYDYDYLFFAGGDGTFNMTINAIPEECKNLPIFGYLPGGSTCDMGYNTNISKKPKIGINDLMNAKVKEYSIGKIDKYRFVYVTGCGGMNAIPHITPVSEKKKFGSLAYAKSFFKYFHLIKESHKVVVDGVVYKSPFVFISNSKEVASFKINSEREEGRELYYIGIVKPGFLWGLFNFIYMMMNGIDKAKEKGYIDTYFQEEFRIDCDYNKWDIDGDEVTIKFPTTVGYSGMKIRLLVNRD